MALGSLACSKYSQHQEYRLPEKCFLSFPLFVSFYAEIPIHMKGIWNKEIYFFPGRSMEKKKKKEREKPSEERTHVISTCNLPSFQSEWMYCKERHGGKVGWSPEGDPTKRPMNTTMFWLSFSNSYILFQFPLVADSLECAKSVTTCRSLVIS